MNKSSLKNFAIAARLELLQRVADRARIYGIDEKNSKAGAIQPSSGFQKLGGALLSAEETAQRNALIGRIYAHGYRQTMEEAAYTWFNRFIAIRYMQTHNRLPVPMRVFPDAPGVQPQMLSAAQDVDLPGVDADQVLAMLDSNQTDALYKYLLIALCNHLAEPLPRMFETISDSTDLLFPDGLLKADSVLGQMAELAEDNWQDIQVIGWLYQYYNTELKDETFELLKKNVKITKERIGAATQLFTPEWIVNYMVENSIGRLWVEGHPSDSLRMGWHYYMEEAQQTPQVAAQLAELRAPYRQMQPEQLTLLDPCMGSGHILVYAFDVLMDIYRSVGYTDRDAVQSIVQNNLYGLDIDDRAAQLAYFAVMMRACDYDHRFLRRGVQPNVYAIAESGPVEEPLLDAFEAEKPLAQRLLRTFANAKEFGSILHVDFTPQELARLRSRLDNMQHAPETSLTSMADSAAAVAAIEPLLQPAEILVGKYDAVVTNPPYMGSSGMNEKLSAFVKENYPDSKSDLFAVFMERCGEMLKERGYQAMITQHAWMFLSSYENLRKKMQKQEIVNMAHLGARAFEEIGGEVVQTTAFVLQKTHTTGYKGSYARLIEPTTQAGKEEMFLAETNRYTAQQENFTKIPGCPVAYWVGEKLVDIFTKGEMLEVHSTVFEGLKTRDKERFVRLWHEIDKPNWKPYAKGGTFRRWYGNNEYVVDWGKNGDAIRAFPKSSGANFKYYNVPTVTYSALTSYKFSGRYIHESIFGGGGGGITNSSEIEVILAFVNSIVFHYMINAISPTLNFEVGQIGQQPLIIDSRYKELIITLAKANIELSRNDWDSFETSWDFKKHPLL